MISFLASPLAFLILLGCERVIEIVISHRNENWALSAGGREYDVRFTRYLVGFHMLWFTGFLAEGVLWSHQILVSPLIALLVFILLQAARYWCIVSLGKFWNTKVIVVPGVALVRRGPYRWLRHPNYLVVVLELFVYPALYGCWMTSLVGGGINLWMVRRRIQGEEQALGLRHAVNSEA